MYPSILEGLKAQRQRLDETLQNDQLAPEIREYVESSRTFLISQITMIEGMVTELESP